MAKWEMVNIPDVLFFQEGPGVRNTQYTSKGVKLLNVANLQDGKLDLSTSERYISTEEAYGKYSHFLVDDGDFIIASSGIKVEYFEKKMGFVNATHLPLCMNTSTIRFKPLDNSKLVIKYFMYFLKTPHFKEQLKRLITGSAQLNFGPSHLKQVSFPLPSLETQHKIADVLDKASALIEKRKAQIEKLDLLIKSQFIEMFGDPTINLKNWAIIKLGDLVYKITDGVHQKPIYKEDGMPFISVVNINGGILNFEGCKFVSCEDYQKMTKSVKPEKGDILYTKVGATYGIPAYVNTETEFCLYVSVALIKPNHELIDSQFLALSMAMPYIKRQADQRIRGIGVPDLHLNQIREFDICLPPRNMQKEFVSFVQSIEAQKSLLQQSLTKLERNYQSLLQKCFRGEIF